MCAMSPVQGSGGVRSLPTTPTRQPVARIEQTGASRPAGRVETALANARLQPGSDPVASRMVSTAQKEAAASMTGPSAETKTFLVKRIYDRSGWPEPGNLEETRQEIAQNHAEQHRLNEQNYADKQGDLESRRSKSKTDLARVQGSFDSNWASERAELSKLLQGETAAGEALAPDLRTRLQEIEKLRRLVAEPGQKVEAYATVLRERESGLASQYKVYVPLDKNEAQQASEGMQKQVNKYIQAHRERLDQQAKVPANPEGVLQKAKDTYSQQMAALDREASLAMDKHTKRQAELQSGTDTRAQKALETHREENALQAVRGSAALKLMGLEDGEPVRIGDRLFITGKSGRAEFSKEGDGYRLLGNTGISGDTTFRQDAQGYWAETTKLKDGYRSTTITRPEPNRENVYTKLNLAQSQPAPVGRKDDSFGKAAFESESLSTRRDGDKVSVDGWRNLQGGGVDMFQETIQPEGAKGTRAEGEYKSAAGVINRWSRTSVPDAKGRMRDRTVSETTEKDGRILRSYELRTEDLEHGHTARTGVETTPNGSKVTREVLNSSGELHSRNILEHQKSEALGDVHRSRRLSGGYEFTNEHSILTTKIGETLETRSETLTRPDGSTRLLSKSKSHQHPPRAATAEEKDLPGRGYYPWSTPQDLMTRLEGHGEEVKIQEVTKEFTGEDGKTVSYTDTKFSTSKEELIREVGPNGKLMWTRRVKEKETGNWDTQTFYQGSNDTMVTHNKKDGPYTVQTTAIELHSHPDAAAGRIPNDSYSVVSRRDATPAQLGEIAKRAGIPESYQETEAVKSWLKSVGNGNVKAEIRESDDSFVDSKQDRKSVSVVLDDGRGNRLILIRDKSNQAFGARHETALQDGTLEGSNSLVSATGERWESRTTPTEAARSAFKVGPDLNKALTRPARTPGMIPPGLDALNSGLAAVSAVHDFANGDVLRGLKNSGDAAQDLGAMALALRDARGMSNAGLSGISGAFKTLGAAGAGVGMITGVNRLSEGEYLAGGTEILSAGLAGVAFFVPGWGWAAAAASAFSFGVNTYTDTKIDAPVKLGGE